MSRNAATRTTQASGRTGLYDNYSTGTNSSLIDKLSDLTGTTLVAGNALSLDTTTGHFPSYDTSGGIELTSVNGAITTVDRTVNWNLSTIKNLTLYLYLTVGDSTLYHEEINSFMQSCTGIQLSTSGGFGGSDTYFTWTLDPYRYMSGLFKVLIDKSEFTAVNGASWSNPITKVRFQCLSASNDTVSVTFSDVRMNDVRKPVFIFTHDDLHLSIYQNAIPILEKYGFKCSLAFVSNWCAAGANGAIPTMNLSQVKELYNKGHEVFNHTSDHSSTSDPTNAVNVLNACKTYMQSNGLIGSENIVAYPSGNTSPGAISAIQSAGYYWGRTVTYEPVTGITPVPVDQTSLLKTNYICTGNDGVSTQIDPPRTLTQVKQMVDYCIANGHMMMFTFHGIVPTPSAVSGYYWGNLWATSDYQSLVQYIFGYTSTGQAQVMRYGDWIKGLQARQSSSVRTSA